MNITQTIAIEVNAKSSQVEAAIALLDEGATVPFISRYRKEVTGGLTDTQLRNLEERLVYLRELEARRQTILTSIEDQGKLAPALKQAILAADNKATLEDLYLPYKPKRRTKAQIAIEAGLEPLAVQLLNEPTCQPNELASQFIDSEKGVADVAQALEGARYILMEQFSESADILGALREYLWQHGLIKSEVAKGKEEEGKKFADYYAYAELIHKIPSHRALALFRGRNEEFLRINLTLEELEQAYCRQQIAQKFNIKNQQRPADKWLLETVDWAWRIKFFTKLELESMMRLRELAEEEAIKVFANNLKHLLLAAPAGSRVTLGLDPGLRTGVKVVVVDDTGKLLDHTVIFPHAPRNDWDNSINLLAKLCVKHRIELVSIGNGTASRETDKLVSELSKRHPELKLNKIVVSEAGASVYSASELAAQEFPSLDVSYRGAVSIARRLQDPLAELVKIEPKAIGVGQYQHDVNQVKLGRSLQGVMEDCVNAVGVDLNTASVPLLKSIAGLNESIARNIVNYREEQGAFKKRNELKRVPRLGEKTFEQAAGFLRINNGENPLDASAVHPEAYTVVEKILTKLQKPLKEVMGNTSLLRSLNPADYTDAQFGIPTVTDIIRELEKPGRDPRPEFKTATFREGVETLADLKPGMLLEGVVTNVANFGAFVDIGVHQDGLVHKSMLADRFVKDPNEVVKVGDIVKVKVLEIDIKRQRVSLTMKLGEIPTVKTKSQTLAKTPSFKQSPKQPQADTAMGNALSAALKRLK
ncbi:MAG: rpsA 2 [Gammaproteobacteria bacterium]|jgi:uncharacterized protein|nr:rpsA 2 [Gammaproteobacteria bacterium]